jgi:hypothetical protein
MMREDRQPKSGVQVVLALAVQVVSVAGVISFLVAVALSSEVFTHWNLNFLQLATTGDIIASGLDVFGRMLIPILAMVIAGYAAWSFEFRWQRWEIALGIGALALLFLLALYLEAENYRVTTEFYQLSAAGDPRAELINITGGRTGSLYYAAVLSTQVLAVFIGARLLYTMFSAMTKNPRRRAIIWITAAGMIAGLLYLPWTVFKAQTYNLSTTGFHNGALQAFDCRGEASSSWPAEGEPGEVAFEQEYATVLWLGDRALVVRCSDQQPQVVLMNDTRGVLRSWGETPVDVTPEEPTQTDEPL